MNRKPKLKLKGNRPQLWVRKPNSFPGLNHQSPMIIVDDIVWIYASNNPGEGMRNWWKTTLSVLPVEYILETEDFVGYL